MSAAELARAHLVEAIDDLDVFLRREEHLHRPLLLRAALRSTIRAAVVLARMIRDWDET